MRYLVVIVVTILVTAGFSYFISVDPKWNELDAMFLLWCVGSYHMIKFAWKKYTEFKP